MKKNLLIAALALTALAGCTSDEYVGDTSPGTAQGNHVAINFSGDAGKMTRATSNTGTVAQMLDHQFKVYGVKNVSNAYSNVFVNYLVWDSNAKTTSNPDVAESGDRNGWEYVGAAGTYGGVEISNAQTIKYWDYSATNYHFVAGSPYGNFTFNLTSGDISTATVTGLAGHITANPKSGEGTALSTNPIYIADPVNVTSTNYKEEVVFSFKRQQTFVRVGVYEIIPGYSISSISFYPYEEASDAWGTTPTNNITLVSKTAKYFKGTSAGTATITYDWSGSSYTFDYTASTLTESKNWYAGLLANGVPATTSTEGTVDNLYGTDKDMATSGYFTVIPSASSLTAQPILIKCDYTLTSTDGSGEVINVKGATAAIPAAFTKWNPNTSYTYLFKISDNTNGTTGTVGTSPEGLFPITFDATVIAELDANKQGFITTVSTPSITTYQEGSVVDTDDPAAHGIKYTTGSAIYFTAQNDETGALNALSELNEESLAVGMVKVYSVTAGSTEADLILTRPTTTVSTTVGSTAWTINGQSVESGKWASFTPSDPGTYAIEYVTSASPSYAYKVVVVE